MKNRIKPTRLIIFLIGIIALVLSFFVSTKTGVLLSLSYTALILINYIISLILKK